MFCREIVTDLHREWSKTPTKPRPLFVHPGTKEQGDFFFDEEWPEIGAIADPTCVVYRDFGIGKASTARLLSPKLVINVFRALFRGNRSGKTAGDPRQMPGYFAIRGERVLWANRPKNPGDHGDLWKAWREERWASR